MSTNSVSHKRLNRDFLDEDPSRDARSIHANSFLLDPENGFARASDDLGEEIAENFLLSATGGESANQDITEANELDELGGSFIETTIEQEVALGTDESTPEEAETVPDSAWTR